jgi:hypothetical protein
MRCVGLPFCVRAVVPGKDTPAAAAAAAPASKKPAITNCIDWSKPLVASITDAVAAAQKAAARQAAQKRQRYEDGLATLQQIADARRTYDNNGEPFEAPHKMRRRAVSSRHGHSKLMVDFELCCLRIASACVGHCG